jgi:hypothetical protein
MSSSCLKEFLGIAFLLLVYEVIQDRGRQSAFLELHKKGYLLTRLVYTDRRNNDKITLRSVNIVP